MQLPEFIEIETSRQCNRKCSWCPAGIYGTRTEQELMEWKIFEKIIDDLANLDYYDTISLHNYNEPILNPRIFKEVKTIRAEIPNSTIAIFSNGDFLNFHTINEFSLAGLTILRITVYPHQFNSIPSTKKIENWIVERKLTDFHWDYEELPENKGLFAITTFQEMQIKVVCPNIKVFNTRADLVRPVIKGSRIKPCYMTTISSAIDYKGRFKMCCNIFPDMEIHKEYVLGNLQDSGFYELWDSPFMQTARKEHRKGDWKNTPICEKCYNLMDDGLND
jgi:MoaA/NifB/PqqE/SkfB family radical SAM enzyme